MPLLRISLTEVSMRTLLLTLFLAAAAHAQSFDAASIHLSAAPVPFESNGIITAGNGALQMRDVTVATCIHYAYGSPLPVIRGPEALKSPHYDILAKADPGTSNAQLRLMLRSLLTERFHLAFHHETAILPVFTLTVSNNNKSATRLHPAPATDHASHQNSPTGMAAHAMTMAELADYLSEALNAPLTDATQLPGRYNFTIDFTTYVDQVRVNNERPDPAAVLHAALKGELGLELNRAKGPAELTVVDHLDPPTPN